MESNYQPETIEIETQNFWNEKKSFYVTEDLTREKYYCLCMFPYPSGRCHMGHVRNYTIGDVIARYHRVLGKNVLQPFGWDAFGLPAENAAIQNKIPPAKWTYQNIEQMRTLIKRLGYGYDWSREIITCKPEYYRWEQWLFTRLFKKGLAYKKKCWVNWDPVDQTVLANEQVVDGKGWRSGAPVLRREITQWFLKITAYAEELLNDLETLTGWPEEVRTMQRNWIGRSEGVTIQFSVVNSNENLEIFTTRADTLFGVTYLALSSEHPLVKNAAKNNPSLQKFIEECNQTQVAEAVMATLEKKGIDTGLKARHPLTQQLIPIWVANFVLMDYGTGAVMSVPAHDQRDYEFAKKYGLPIQQVIQPLDDSSCDLTQQAFTDQGTLVNSQEFSGLSSSEAIVSIRDVLRQYKLGKRTITYRLRDWGVSRQRYWGTPIPMIYCEKCGDVPVPEDDLPVVLPEQIQFEGVQSPLKSMPIFYQTSCPKCGSKATRETDTFDTFVESSWYYARFGCMSQHKTMFDDRARYWTPVDQYVGGIEHAVMHLLYARFFHKVMRDEGLLNSDEPFTRLLNQGMVIKDGAKMSKSKGNIVEPQAMIDQYGADSVRFFMIFTAPPSQSLEWSDAGIEGSARFLKRLWNFSHQHHEMLQQINYRLKNHLQASIDWQTAPNEYKTARRELYSIVKQANYDYERMQYNTVASACMKLLNTLNDIEKLHDQDPYGPHLIQEGMSALLRLLQPICPHICQTLWQQLTFGDDILFAKWPKVVQEALVTDSVSLVIQINGKTRMQLEVPIDSNQESVLVLLHAQEKIKKYLAEGTLKKVIYVPKKLLNLVIVKDSQ